MPLTRHFYESDEVQSSLYYCSSRRDLKETEFWCHEMVISGYSSEAISVLFESWLWQHGPFYLRWLLDARTLMEKTVSEQAIMNAAVQLSSCAEWDNSVWAILMSDAKADRVTMKTPPWIPSDCDAAHLFLYRALYQGKARSAWAMVLRQAPKKMWSLLREYGIHLSPLYAECLDILEHYEDLLGYKSDAYDTVILCVATLMLCLSPTKRESSFQHRPYQERSFCIPIGRKTARLYSIPSVALYGTRRGTTLCTQYHTNGLYDIEKEIKGCPFWDEALREYQRQGKWVSDDAMEAFYDRYFPDDIPDEWSKEEKLKSHGAGLLHAGDRMTLQRYAKIHFTKPCRLAFMSTILKLDGMEGCNVLDAIQYRSVEINLKPVRRRYVS